MPSSQRKLDSARANAAKSTGPRSQRGKTAVALNSVTHGLTAQTVVLQNESEEEYEIELQHYLEHFLPQGKPEIDLVRQLAAAHWRVARYAGVESGILEHKMDDQADWIKEHYTRIPEYFRLALAFESLAEGHAASLINRYQARLHREYQRLLKALVELQSARQSREAKLQSKGCLSL